MEFTFENNMQIAPEVVSRNSNDGTVIVMKMTDDNFFYKINGVAAEMWMKISAQNSNLGEVIKEISTEYNIPEDQIKKDAQEFLNKAYELKLIQII